MSKANYRDLSKRERQIMDIIHQQGEASVGDVLERLPDPPGYNSVRMLMNILEQKGHLKHRNEKNKYFYSATLKEEVVKNSALDHLLSTYFDRSVPQVMSALLSHKRVSSDELEELEKMIADARKKEENRKTT